jgi:Concanavalin A-like lectin/glucanases superfamily
MAIRFDNSADALSRTTGVPLPTAFTIMGWCRTVTNTGGAFQTIFDMDGGGLDLQFYINSSNQLFVWNSGSSAGSATVLSTGTWYHLAWTDDGFYINGVLDHAVTAVTGANPATFRLGHSRFGGENWNGRMQAVKVWDATLSAAEIQQEMRQHLPVRVANLNAFYPFLSSTDVADYSGNAQTLTVGGTLTTEDGPPVAWMMARGRRVHIAAAAGGGGSVSPWFFQQRVLRARRAA